MIKTKVQSNPAAPTETPEEKAAREAEQQRAEAAQIDETQGLLRLDTLRRSRRYGRLGAKSSFSGSGGSGSGALAPSSAAPASSSSAGGAGYGFNNGSSYTTNVE